MGRRLTGFFTELLAALRAPLSGDPPVGDATCPECGRPVIVATDRTQGSPLTGPMMSPRSRHELRAACPVHGRSADPTGLPDGTGPSDRTGPSDGTGPTDAST